MSDEALTDTFVMLCGWRGHCAWASGGNPCVKVGEVVWEYLAKDSQEQAKLALARVVTLRETQQLEVVRDNGDRYRTWLWPLDLPEMAVCILGLRVPGALVELTDRERECLELLAQGVDTRFIAEKLGVGLGTVHTHLRNSREKLGLPSMESLISFAARYCYPDNVPLDLPAVGNRWS